MTELDKKISAKIPSNDTNIEIFRSVCDICAPGPHCGVDCYVKNGVIIKIEGSSGHPANNGILCTKGQAGRQYVYRKDRIKTPLKRIGLRGQGVFQPITWDEALTTIAKRLNSIKKESGAESVAFFSGYDKWYRPFLQRLAYSFGTPNYGTESSSCFTSTIMSWQLATGYDAVNIDFPNTRIFLGWAANPYHMMPFLINILEKRHKEGMKVIIIDPRITPTVEKLCDLHLRPLPGTDGALALGIARELIINGWYDKKYVEENVYGFEQFRNYTLDFTADKVEKITTVPAKQLKLAAKMLWENRPMAINQSAAALVHHKNGMQNHRAIMALSALLGSFDRPGGLVPNPLTYAHSSGGFMTRDEEFSHATYPRNSPAPVGASRFPLWQKMVGEMQTCDLSRQILSGSPYPIRALVSHGMNMRMFNADTELIKAFHKLDFFVDTDLFLTDTAKYADIVLPACSSFERGEFKVYNGGFSQYTRPVIRPLYQSRPDTEIITALAKLIAPDDKLLCEGTDACLNWILDGLDIDLEYLKANSQFPQKLPNFKPSPIGSHPFKTPTGKFELLSTIISELGESNLDALPTYRASLDDADSEKYPFIMVSGSRLPNALHSRLHDVPWLRSLRPEPMADINFDDAKAMNISYLDTINISSPLGTITVKANPSYLVKRGTIHMYHGYREADINSLISSEHNDPYSGFPGYRSFRCRIDKEA